MHYRGELQKAPIDVAVVRVHVQGLRDRGLGLRQIAKQATVTKHVVNRVLRGQKVYRTSLVKLSAAKPIIAAHALVPGLPAWRIVKWLESEGFSRDRIARLIGLRGGKPIVLRKRYTMRVVARLRRLKRYFEDQDPGRGSPFGDIEDPAG